MEKVVYLQHRSFLPSIDALHTDRDNFPSHSEAGILPEMKTMAYVDTQNAKLTAASTVAERKSIIRESGCKGPYSLRSLPHHDRFLNTPVEPMHVIKNVAERLVKLLSGVTDTVKVRKAEQQSNRFMTTWTKKVIKNGKEVEHLPPAPFTLQKEEVTVANSRALSVRAPSYVDWKPCHFFSKSAVQLNSNQWKHVLASGILKFCIRGLLGAKQRNTLTELCNVTHLLCAETVHVQELDSLECRVHHVLSRLERDFPMSIHVITIHLLHHLPMYLRRFGPTYGFWMFPMERFNSWISRRILNRRFPEASVMETYRLFEFAFFLQLSGQLPSGSTTDFSPTSTSELEEDSEGFNELCMDVPPVRGYSATLDQCLVKDLTSCYKNTYPEYACLLSRYKKEKREAKKRHKVSDFPSISQWSPQSGPLLTQSEKNLLDGPAKSITQFNVYMTRDKHNRLLKYGTVKGERVNSVHVSSYVQCCSPACKEIVFGRIVSIFHHTFNGTVHTLAHVHWYESATCDPESGLYYSTLGSANQSVPKIMPLLNLSRPIIHAVYEDKIWFLENNY